MEIKKLRMGKDFALVWTIKAKRGGEDAPYIPSSDSVLLLVTPYNKIKVEGATFDGNTVRWIFRGKDQHRPGVYGLELVENQGKNGMVTIDTCKAFELVEHTCEETGQDGDGVIFETLELTSDVELTALQGPEGPQGPQGPAGPQGPQGEPGPQGPAGPSYDDAELRERIAELEAENETLRTEIESQNEIIEDLQNTKIDKEADDYYPQLSVGVADNLAGVDEVASDFNFRQSGGGAIADGSARVVSIKGNSSVVNQIYPTDIEKQLSSGLYLISRGGLITLTGTISSNFAPLLQFEDNRENNVYLFTLEIIQDTDGILDGAKFGLLNRATNTLIESKFSYVIYKNTSPGSPRNVGFSGLANATVFNNVQVRVNQHNLTQMFGPGYEPTTLAEFYQRIPEGIDLDAYNPGQIVDMKATGILSTSANAWDGKLERGRLTDGQPDNLTESSMVYSPTYMPVLPGAQYYAKVGLYKGAQVVFYPHFYDRSRNYLSTLVGFYNKTFTAPANAAFMRFFLYNGDGLETEFSDICINLSNGETNGKYFPHIEAREDLSIVRKYFPDGMRSWLSACDELRYNSATNKWEKVVRIGAVDLGAQNFTYQKPIEGTYPHGYFLTQIAGKAIGNSNLLCAKYNTIADWVSVGVRGSESSTNVYVKDSAYASAADFKAAMQGVVLYYELAEPIVTEIEEADFNTDYKVWNGGTEQMIADGPSSALRADITYGFNATGLLKQIKAALVAAGIM